MSTEQRDPALTDAAPIHATEPRDRADVPESGLAARGRAGSHAGVRRAVPALVTAAVLVPVLLLVPLLGAMLAFGVFVAAVPFGRTASARIVAGVVLLSGLLAAETVVGAQSSFRLDVHTAILIAAVPGAIGVGFLARGKGVRAALPRLDGGVVPLVGTPMMSWLLTGATLVGRPQEAVMGGLSALGWDHQSHFTVFVNLYTQGGVWHASSGVPQPSFDTYPPLAGVLESWGVLLADGRLVPTDQLVSRFAQSAAVLAAIALGLIAWLGAAATAALLRKRSRPGTRAVPAVVGAVLGAYLCLGPPISFFDYGFTNFLLAVALALSASWLTITPGLGVRRSAVLVAAAGAALILLWPPLLLLLAPAALVLAWRILRGRQWSALPPTIVLALVAGWIALWQVRRLAPDRSSASSLATTVGGLAGGMPPVPLAQAIGFTFAALMLLVLGRRAQRPAWSAVLAPTVGGVLLVVAFSAIALRSGTRPMNSYYAAKAAWAFYLVALPAAGAVLGVAIGALGDGVAARAGNARQGGNLGRVALAGLCGAALFWSSLGYVNIPGSKSGYVAVPPAFDSIFARWHAFRNVDAGYLVYAASRAIGPSHDSVPVIWDGGDLKQNRWLGTVRGQLDGRADSVYNPMPGGPYLQPAADALRNRLVIDPTLRLSVAYFRPESKALLDPLVRDFPGRVRLVVFTLPPPATA